MPHILSRILRYGSIFAMSGYSDGHGSQGVGGLISEMNSVRKNLNHKCSSETLEHENHCFLFDLRLFCVYIYVDPRSFCMGGPDGPRTQNYIYTQNWKNKAPMVEFAGMP